MRNNKMKGFTLVELLVVIAILAILATVSVVGYTSYIESANISNDQNIATQLNRFLAAYMADHTGEHYGEPITEDNIREITQAILEDSGLDDLDPYADGYHFYFHFDGNGSGEYIAMSDKDMIHTAGYKVLANSFNVSALNVNSNYLGSCFTTDSTYFFVDTKGSPLAEVIETLYNFNADVDYVALMNKVNGLVDSEGAKIQKLIDYVTSAVVVTDDANYRLGTTQEVVIFADGVTAVSTNNMKYDKGWVATEGKLADFTGTLTIPNTIEYFAGNSLLLGDGAEIKIDKTVSEVAKMAYQNFTNATIKLNDGTFYTANAGKLEGNTTKPVIADDVTNIPTVELPLEYSNPMSDFVATPMSDKDKKVYDHKDNSGYVAWDVGSFDLKVLLDNCVGGKKSELPATDISVTWSVADEYKKYISVTPEGKVTFTSNKPINEIVVTATSTYNPALTKDFTIEVVYVNNVNYTFNGKDAIVNKDFTLLYGEAKAAETYGLTNISVTPNITVSEDFIKLDSTVYMSLPTETATSKNILEFVAGSTTTLKPTSTTIDGTQSVTIKTGAYSYLDKELSLTLFNKNSLTFGAINDNIKFVAADATNPITIGELLDLNSGKKLPANAEIWLLKEFGDTDPYGNLSENSIESDCIENYIISLTGDDWKNTTIPFNASGTVMVAVVVDNIRVSEQRLVEVVADAVNVRSENDLSSTANNTLLKDIDLDGVDGTDDNGGKMIIAKGKTFYGNGFTITVKDGIRKYVEGHGNGVIGLSGTLRDTRVIGEVFTDWAGRVSVDGGSSTVTVMASGAELINCYIANSRSPLRLDNNATVENCVFFGGRHANIDISGSYTLTIHGTVITVNQVGEESYNQAGVGIATWWSNGIQSMINVEDYTDDNNNFIKADLIQYNFISENDTGNLPKINTNSMGIPLGDAIEIKMSIIFDNLMSQTIYQEQNLIHGTTTKYVNAGIVYLNKTKSEVNEPIGVEGYFKTDYTLTAEIAYPSTEKCDWNGGYLGHGKGICPHRVAFEKALGIALDDDTKKSLSVVVYTLLNNSDNGKETFAAHADAVETYNPNAWFFDANGNIIHDAN